uniref:EGF-like domain-containing protein n=1 Tax=Ditylenchus dipsaci TaxID=166011 RepID=A0A915E6Y4_9BILA
MDQIESQHPMISLACLCFVIFSTICNALPMPAAPADSSMGARESYAVLKSFMLTGVKNVRWETTPMMYADAKGNPMPNKSGASKNADGSTVFGCADASGKMQPHGSEYERPSGKFKYSCNNGVEEVVACVGSDRTNKARIEVGQTLDVNGFWHKCQSFPNQSVVYTQEPSCAHGGKEYRVGEEVNVGNMRLQCIDTGYKVVGCYYQDENNNLVSLNSGEKKEAGKVVHVCGKEYKEGEEFNQNHLNYKCSNGMVDVTGCYMNDSKPLNIGQDVVDNQMAYRCYRIGGKIEYSEYACGYNGTPSCTLAPMPQTPDDVPQLGRGLQAPGVGSFSVVQTVSGSDVVQSPGTLKLQLEKAMGPTTTLSLFTLILPKNTVSVSNLSNSSGLFYLVTIKTTGANHQTRVLDSINTWFQLAPQNVYFVSDKEDIQTSQLTQDHLLNSKCPSTHDISGLCCKMGVELQLALSLHPKWWCHFDDDNYVNLEQLEKLLVKLDPSVDYYLGRASTSVPVKMTEQRNPEETPLLNEFWFGTGGAGICLSYSSLHKIRAFVKGKRFSRLCQTAGVPDDVTLGYVMTQLLNIPLTPIKLFHSHLEELKKINRNTIYSQVSLSAGDRNLVDVPQILPQHLDPRSGTAAQKRRAPRIICENGSEVNGACLCKQGYAGAHCERKMHCLSFERTRNGSCFSCKENFEGDRCEHIFCEHGQEAEFEQKCICERPFTGAHCNELITRDVYFFYNSRVATIGPLGALILIPMFLIYYGCEHYAKKRQVHRIEKIWMDQTNVSVDSDRIKSLLAEKP